MAQQSRNRGPDFGEDQTSVNNTGHTLLLMLAQTPSAHAAPVAVAPVAASPVAAAPGSAALFWVLAALIVVGAVGVVVFRDIVRMAASLLLTLLAVAGLYFLLAAEFLAAVQLLVYVGGTLVLIIFGVMLTSQSPAGRLAADRTETLVSLALTGVLLAALVAAIVIHQSSDAAQPGDGTPVAAASAHEIDPAQSIGRALLSRYLLPFELASVVLLVVMVGAAYLAKARRARSDEASSGAAQP